MVDLPCQRVIGKACFQEYPEFARRAIAYRLLHLLIPPDIAKILPKKLSDPLIAPGVTIPLGAKFPPGTCIVPGCSFPAGWDPDDEPPECAKSAPLPTLAMQEGGGNPSVFLSPGEPGTSQVHPPAAPPAWTKAAWNPADKHAEISLSNNDLTATSNYAFGSMKCARALSSLVSTGKYYWEITVDYEDANSVIIGIANLAKDLTTYLGADVNGYGCYCVGRGYYNGSYIALSSFTTGDIIQTALDLDDGKIWWGKNGTWEGGGDPGAGTGEQYSGITGAWRPACSLKTLNEITANFGDSAFAYSVPNGFKSGFPGES